MTSARRATQSISRTVVLSLRSTCCDTPPVLIEVFAKAHWSIGRLVHAKYFVCDDCARPCDVKWPA